MNTIPRLHTLSTHCVVFWLLLFWAKMNTVLTWEIIIYFSQCVLTEIQLCNSLVCFEWLSSCIQLSNLTKTALITLELEWTFAASEISVWKRWSSKNAASFITDWNVLFFSLYLNVPWNWLCFQCNLITPHWAYGIFSQCQLSRQLWNTFMPFFKWEIN